MKNIVQAILVDQQPKAKLKQFKLVHTDVQMELVILLVVHQVGDVMTIQQKRIEDLIVVGQVKLLAQMDVVMEVV